MSDLGKTSSTIYCDEVTEKGFTVDNEDIGFIGLEMSSLGAISSSLHCKRRPKRC